MIFSLDKKTIKSMALACLICSIMMAKANSSSADDSGTWSGRVNAGGFITDGNSQKKAGTFDGFAQARTEKNRYRAGGELRFAEDEGEETENELKVYGEYDHFMNEKLYAGVGASYEVDKIADLDRRVEVGPYIGYQYYETEPLNLSTRLGLNYIGEELSTGDKEDDLAASWGADYDQKFYDETIQLFYKHDLNVPLDDTEGFLFDAETGVRFPVAKVLTGTVQIDFDWDNAPAPDVKEQDVTYSIKLGYEF